jgi:AmmeMemoRadiSam system protein A
MQRAEPRSPTAIDSDDHLGHELLAIARASIARALGRSGVDDPDDDPRLHQNGATFVTLTHARTGELQGCIGSLEPRRPLASDVRANAVAAAFLDPRSDPLTPDAYDDLVVEVSLLGPLEAMPVTSEEDALTQMKRDEGYVLGWGPMRGVLLPQVWDRCADAATFLRYLKMKAGLPSDFWAEGVRMQRFHLSKWRDVTH